MKGLFFCLLLIVNSLSYGQSKSTHYSSNARGHFTHGGHTAGVNTKAKTINIWTTGYKQSSSYATNIINIGTNKDTSSLGNYNNNTSRIGVKVYPNPFKNTINVSITGDSPIGSISIYSISGKKVFYRELSKNMEQLPLTELAKGTYIIHVNTTEGNSIGRMIKY